MPTNFPGKFFPCNSLYQVFYWIFNLILKSNFFTFYAMKSQALQSNVQVLENSEASENEKAKLSLDNNLGPQLAFLTGLAGVIHYLFSCACPT